MATTPRTLVILLDYVIQFGLLLPFQDIIEGTPLQAFRVIDFRDIEKSRQ